MTTTPGTAPDLEGWTHAHSGKVRDLYVPAGATSGAGGDVVLVVASDRISAFDYVLPTTIPDKGKILTAMSLWWFEQLEDVVPHHVVSLDVPGQVAGRAMICRQLRMYPIECVARGYITGSALSEYRATASVCGVPLPPGLVESDKLPEPIFTPAAKAQMGEHDENITFEDMAERVGDTAARRLRETTLEVYERAADLAARRGMILADTKLEFGASPHPGEPEIVLADEVLTPDSSRFWAAADYEPGRPQLSYDKQFVRDWLLSPDAGWDRRDDTPPPALPDDVVERTRERYVEAYELLTGRTFTA
ncbi:phosphoribosylaminoimidazolesuccinocarboxamide synthase [Georgenia thermotolerans]|uniref:Phosphoribosylaminoimidazole-succinocarboxamide synthase n=1 Tax=Georgenia thermotolerans TaxID=527326 RepID=A0A7J5USB5_9MICO|nr:phosphoribosylaminoimidazolesuccinocarboxamide synthase [Georgenia thermotolerans]KAE8765177.1 phosphoribosylaminoimidazolesuccinocarboxamide synthase [Georgenia thermotolerans]